MNEARIVFIPTRGRWDRLDKIVDPWIVADFRVVFVTELDQEKFAGEFMDRRENPRSGSVNVLHLLDDKPGKGIGHVRHEILKFADRENIDAFVMSDDDVHPHQNHMHPQWLLATVRKYPVLACAASHSQQNHFLGGLLDSHPNQPVLAANGICFQMFAINTERALDVGGFDETLKVYEDAEFMRCGIKHGYPWALHTGVRMVKTGRSGDAGGIQDYLDVKERESTIVDDVRTRLADRWGDDIITRPPKRARQSWIKMYDRYMPNWRAYSAGHGGSLNSMMQEKNT